MKVCPTIFFQFNLRLELVLFCRSVTKFHFQKKSKKVSKKEFFSSACVEGLLSFPLALCQNYRQTFFRFCVGISKLRNIGVHKEKQGLIYIYSIFRRWRRYRKNVQFNDKRESRQSSRIVEMAKVFYTRLN